MPGSESSKPAIKTLEQRIIERAEQRLRESVEKATMALHIIAGQGVIDQPSGIMDMSVDEAINAVGAAIVRLRGPAVASKALDQALEELADRLEPSRLMQAAAMPSRER